MRSWPPLPSRVAVVALAVLSPAVLSPARADFAAAAERPNIVWLVSEDNSKHFLRLFDSGGATTPRIESLADSGLVFDHAFSNAPVCSVARTTLITGCFAPRIGTQYHRRRVAVPLPDGLRMFPAYLRDAGYHTTNNQKKDYNAFEGPGVWDESSRQATWRDRRDGQPFFHMRSFAESHESSLHFPEDAIGGEPTETDPADVFLPPHHPDTPTFRYTYARYHDRMKVIDRRIGRVIDQLRDDGLLEDTFVFYFGDHGGVLPRSKGYAYETGLHVPLVVRIPENFKHLAPFEKGARVGGFVSFVDFGPTVLRLAGVEVPDAMDGRPFLGPGVTRADVESRDETFGHADRFDEKYDMVRSLRKGRYKYVRSFQPFNHDGLRNNYRYRMAAYRQWRRMFEGGELDERQRQFFERREAEALFDLHDDPYEVRNLAHDPRYAETLENMRRRLFQRMKELPDLSLFPESELVRHAADDPAAWGRARREQIARLLDVANLSLSPAADVRPRVAECLESSDPWSRYWGLIVCGCHGESARPLVERARRLAADDPHVLVRTRAAEFLGLIGADDPRPVVLSALAETASPAEATLILNSLVLLRDGKPGYGFDVSSLKLQPAVARDELVRRRLEYLQAGEN